MDRIWQWAWDRYGARYSWAVCAVSLPILLPVYLFWSFVIVAFDHHDSGNTIQVRACLAVLARLFDHLRRYEAAATIAGFAFNPITAAWYGEITTVIAHLRDVHGDQTYEALAHIGEAMTTTEIAAYAYDQIDQARAELDAVSK